MHTVYGASTAHAAGFAKSRLHRALCMAPRPVAGADQRDANARWGAPCGWLRRRGLGGLFGAHACRQPVGDGCVLTRNGNSGDRYSLRPRVVENLQITFLDFLGWPLVNDRVYPFRSGAGVSLPRMGVKIVVTVGTLSKALVAS